MPEFHRPVMLAEVLGFLEPKSGQVIVDGTVGGGGHALEIVKRILADGRLIGIDRDEAALREAAERLKPYSQNVIFEKGNFADLEAIAERLGIRAVDGVILDLGASSYQLERAPERGFSFRHDAPLDMRFDTSQGVTARELVNTLSEQELADLIRRFGEERWAKRIAEFIVERRRRKPIETTFELVDVILAAIPVGARPRTIHPATRTFQALRIGVNRELESLQAGLNAAIRLLAKGGRVCVLSYHSLEDRIVKNTFAKYAGRCVCPPALPTCVCGAERTLEILTRRPVTPTKEEIRANPRARSAKLRAAMKL
jgi:16S rRNA (cytosine1402-N4)-methyltransferase